MGPAPADLATPPRACRPPPPLQRPATYSSTSSSSPSCSSPSRPSSRSPSRPRPRSPASRPTSAPSPAGRSGSSSAAGRPLRSCTRPTTSCSTCRLPLSPLSATFWILSHLLAVEADTHARPPAAHQLMYLPVLVPLNLLASGLAQDRSNIWPLVLVNIGSWCVDWLPFPLSWLPLPPLSLAFDSPG